MTVLTLALGAIAYGVHIPASTLPGLIVTLVLGTAAFTALGIGITRFIPNAEAAPVVVNLVILPLDVHLEHLVPSERDAQLAGGDREDLPDPGAG